MRKKPIEYSSEMNSLKDLVAHQERVINDFKRKEESHDLVIKRLKETIKVSNNKLRDELQEKYQSQQQKLNLS